MDKTTSASVGRAYPPAYVYNGLLLRVQSLEGGCNILEKENIRLRTGLELLGMMVDRFTESGHDAYTDACFRNEMRHMVADLLKDRE